MKDIFDMQMQLNICTLSNIGLDFQEIMADPEKKYSWIENYRKALSAEFAEWVREIMENGLETGNAKIEVVDILHFLVSLSQIVGIDHDEAMSVSAKGRTATTVAQVIIQSFLALDELQNSVKWKWWAKGGGFNPDRAINAVRALWHSFYVLCALCGMDDDKIKETYLEKNRVNFMRQARGYNEDTKAEANNEGIHA